MRLFRVMITIAAVLPLAACWSPVALRSPVASLQTASVNYRARAPVASEAFDLVVSRGSDGGLGVVVDQDNVVVTVTAQPDLQVGDVIVGVDGIPLSGFIGQALTPGAPTYTFSVKRLASGVVDASASLERNLLQMVRLADDERRADRKAQFEGKIFGLMSFEEGSESNGKAAALVDALEDAASKAASSGGGSGSLVPSGTEELRVALNSGFWRLVLCSDAATSAAGLTGYGTAPYCTVLASFQAFLPENPDRPDLPTAQVVEVIAKQNTGSSLIAALKGGWEGSEASAGAVERYDRLEFDGTPEFQEEPIEQRWDCTYLSSSLRVCRMRTSADGAATEGEWRVYEKMEAGKAQAEIGRLIDTPLPKSRGESLDDIPDWARARSTGAAGGYGLIGGGGGPGPMAEPDSMR